jgi:hypothetical protein
MLSQHGYMMPTFVFQLSTACLDCDRLCMTTTMFHSDPPPTTNAPPDLPAMIEACACRLPTATVYRLMTNTMSRPPSHTHQTCLP